jgi:NAD(P)-dependent dehydrogenase (short-subunit alcohol dehydrogenase family)
MSDVDGRVALVTGASRGIGMAVARRLAREGATVVLVARTAEAGASRLVGSLAETRAAIVATGGRASTIAADLSAPDFDGDRLIGEIESTFGPVDILVNNAAFVPLAPLTAATTRHWELALRVNVIAPWALAVRTVASMKQRGGGAIVNVTSVAAELPGSAGWEPTTPTTLGSVYGATKAALNRWTVGLAAELEGSGVVVNALSPQVSVVTESALLGGHVNAGRTEPMETVVEAIVALCSPATAGGSGRVRYSLELIKELQRPVYGLDENVLYPGWQPADIAAELLSRSG